MNPDADAEAALRAAYGKRLSEVFREFCESIALLPPDGKELPIEGLQVAARLFASHGSFPTYSVWRAMVLHDRGVEAKAEFKQLGENGMEGRAPSPGAAQLRAVQIKGGERTTKAEWDRLVAKYPGKRLKGDDHKWNLTEEEIAEALR